MKWFPAGREEVVRGLYMYPSCPGKDMLPVEDLSPGRSTEIAPAPYPEVRLLG